MKFNTVNKVSQKIKDYSISILKYKINDYKIREYKIEVYCTISSSRLHYILFSKYTVHNFKVQRLY